MCMKRGLVVGRFQPFHRGHLGLIHEMEAASDIGEIIIGIGSAQKLHEPMNPFSAEERKHMISASVQCSKPYHLICLEDKGDNTLWTEHVIATVPAFDVIYSGNPLVRELFTTRGYEVRPPCTRYGVSATLIRELMAQGKEWMLHLPDGARDIVNSIQGENRVRSLNSNNYAER